MSVLLLQIALILVAAKVGGEICERWMKQPAVLGELVGGVLVGPSVLGWIPAENDFLLHFAELGAILLLFEVGLESNIAELFKVGKQALWVAVAGVIFPFIFGYFVAHAFGRTVMESIFVGAALTATSVGITARVFGDLRSLHTKEAKIVLGAAVADDVIGLIILAVVSGMAITKVISWVAVGQQTAMALIFLVGAILVGMKATPYILHWARKMQIRAAVSSTAVIFCLLLAAIADMVKLAPIVGAFAAGLILERADDKIHIEHKIKALADLFVPLFFVITGARMDVQMFNPATVAGRGTLVLGGVLFLVAVVGKVIGGMSVPGRKLNRLTIGIGMIPRGEVGLLFATLGLNSRVIDKGLYAAIIFVVITTTFITPPLLKLILHRHKPKGEDKQETSLNTRTSLASTVE
ncbi:MAG: cation:proton antiporter [Armatimonadetes bacterium]|nr:cation:proton antiporter [Armatimonadota bacterium]